jgi:hypothetical protein
LRSDKETTMKRYLKAITGLAFAVILVLAAAHTGAQTSGQNANGRRIEGNWLVEVTDRNCQTGAVIATLPALHTFMAGGSMLSDPAVNPAILRTGHGVWEHVGGQNFTNTIVLFRFNPANGAYEGTVTIRRNIELGENSDEMTSTDTAEAADPNGNVVGTRCATTIARRIE